MRFIFKDGFGDVHITFVLMVKFKLLSQFPGDHLPHIVVFTLILFLALFYCIPLSMFNRFISIRSDSVSLFRFPFLATSKFFRGRFRLFVA